MDLTELLRYVQVALGIGLVIFVHEAGHFLAARLCGVRVEVFSLGFGPRLLAWRRGATVYQVALVPLGGFVKMAGDEPRGDGSAPAPDELRAKSVGQRFLIYSGGVLMNIAFGLVVFPILLSVGVPFLPPVIGSALPGGPAWHARLEPGTRVLSVNGSEMIGFLNIANEVALSPSDDISLEVVDPGASTSRHVQLQSRYQERIGFRSIDIVPALDLEGRIEVAANSPAAAAGLQSGDRLLAVEGGFEELPLEEQLELAMEQAEPLQLRVAGISGEAESLRSARITPTSAPATGPPRLGILPAQNLLSDTRDSATVRALGVQAGDRIVSCNGRSVLRRSDLLAALTSSSEPVVMRVMRRGAELDLTAPALDRRAAIDLWHDLAIQQDTANTVLMVTPGSPAASAGILDGDTVLRIDGVPMESWEAVRARTLRAAEHGESLLFTIQRKNTDGEVALVELRAAPAPMQLWTYGFGVREAEYVYRAPNAGAAVRIGVQSSWKFFTDAWLTLKGIVRGRVSGDNLGGIIRIVDVSYSWASVGLAKLMFFLCMLSVNLAFLNLLPIPVLDGGHLFFLAVEKIKGSPVSERVLGYSQVVGLVLILSLMIYVTYNDLVFFLRD